MRWLWLLTTAIWLFANVFLALRWPALYGRVDIAAYLLTAVAAIATLAGVGFALLGFLQLGRLEQMVEAAVQRKKEELWGEWERVALAIQEATHRVIAGYAVMEKGDYARAESLFAEAVRIDPRAFNGYISLGYARLALGRIAAAVEAFSRAKALFPDRPEPRFDLARAYIRAGEDDGALTELREAVRLRPGDLAQFADDPDFADLRRRRREDWARLEELARDGMSK
ncbi:MAG: tetratricopeptide repeat protein [Clostridia bacterium]|nr:tetratricopeptide repeat protein [Clostridia bacterium]